MTSEEKALAKKEIMKVLKEQGLDLTEEMVVTAIRASAAMLRTVIKLTPTKFDDLALPIITPIESLLLGFADKIDGNDDEGR